jgi:hypothetical protein
LRHSFSVGAQSKARSQAGGLCRLPFEESIAQDLVSYLFAQISTYWNAGIVDN